MLSLEKIYFATCKTKRPPFNKSEPDTKRKKNNFVPRVVCKRSDFRAHAGGVDY